MDFTYMKDFMKHFVDMGVPGNTIRVWQNHNEIFSHTEGYRDKEENIKTANKLGMLGRNVKPDNYDSIIELLKEYNINFN